MSAPTIGHLDPQYIAIMDETCELLRQVFRTKNPLTFPVSGTGMAGMECVATNLIEPGDAMLVCVAGVFGQRMKDVAQRAGARVTAVDRSAVRLARLREALKAVGKDIANARLRFGNGCIANVTASRISRERVRKIRFFEPDAYVSIDYAAQEVEMYRLVRGAGDQPRIEGGRLEVVREEPLVRELTDFLGAVRDGRPPLVTGQDGRRALALAERIASRMVDGA